jgi:AcrR family transcriptional regulator
VLTVTDVICQMAICQMVNSARVAVKTRERLLQLAIDYVSRNGMTDVSLRRLAAELGTSHQLLLHHFGSKDGLWVAIVQAVEQRERERFAAIVPDPDQPPGGAVRAWWTHISDPVLWPNERLFFELYGQALQGRPYSADLLTGIVESWIEPAAALGIANGVPPAVARAHARLGVAVGRGLLLDLLATGDRDAVDAAMDAFIELYEVWLERSSAA